MMERECKNCNEVKNVLEFWVAKKANGIYLVCKECMKKKKKESEFQKINKKVPYDPAYHWKKKKNL